jgi:hypothetical protein
MDALGETMVVRHPVDRQVLNGNAAAMGFLAGCL